MADFAKPLSQLATRQVQVDPTPGQGIALDHRSLIPVNALGSGTTASNVFLAGDQSWRSIAGGTGGADGGVGIVASNTTWSTGTITISGFGAATVNTAANLVRISVPVQTAQTGISGLQATNTTFTSGTVTITGSNMITVKSSALGQGIVLDATQSVQTQNFVALAVTNTTYSSGTAVLTGSHAATVKSSAAGQTGIVDVLAIQSIAVSDSTFGGPTVTLSGSGGITVKSGAADNQIIIEQATVAGGAAPTLSLWRNMNIQGYTAPIQSGPSLTGNNRTVGVFPLVQNELTVFPGNMTVSTMDMLFTISGSTATMSAAYTTILRVGIYTYNAGTLSLLNSVSTTWGTGAANANNSSIFVGNRWLTIHSSAWSAQPTFSQGSYWIATQISTAGAANQTGAVYGQSIAPQNLTFSGTIGAASASATSDGWYPFFGIYSVTTAALPTAINSNNLNKQGNAAVHVPMVIFNNVSNTF